MLRNRRLDAFNKRRHTFFTGGESVAMLGEIVQMDIDDDHHRVAHVVKGDDFIRQHECADRHVQLGL